MLSNYFDYIISISLSSFSILSLILNSITIYILTRPKFLKESIFRYFLVNELISTSSLILFVLHFIPFLISWDLPIIYCQIREFFGFTIYHCYPWVCVLNSVDRLLSVKYQRKFKFIKLFKYQFLAILLIFFSSALINVPRFLYAGFSNNSVCALNSIQIGIFLSIENLLLSNIIPFFIMILTTFSSVHYMITKKRRLQLNLVNYRREKDFVKNVAIMDLWFLVGFLTFSISVLYQYLYNYPIYDENNSKILVQVSECLMFSEVSFNFFVYLSCNKQFRNYALSMIGYCRGTSRIRQSNIYT
jgi:hypothetical protein